MNAPIQKRGTSDLRSMLEAASSRFKTVLPAHVKPEAFIRKAIFAASKTPGLLDCTPLSVVQAVMQAAQLGLDPTGTLGSGYLVPFKKTCTFIPGYRGLIDLARRSGQIISIEAHPVFDGEDFVCEWGLEAKLVHKPKFLTEEQGKLKYVYAVAKLRDGGVQWEVMAKSQVDTVRAQSKASGSGPWVSHYVQMALKTVIRRMVKYLPMSTELARALEIDDAVEAGEPLPDFDVELPPPEPQQSKTDAVKAAIDAKAVESKPPEPEQEEPQEPGSEG